MPFISASAISPYNSIRGGAEGATPLLLDLYPDAVSAYSLRKLRTAYTGPAIRVQSSGGGEPQDFGFDSNGELDTASLLSFVGASNDGSAPIWYDQSGNTNNQTQTTANRQPQIVNSGSLITLNEKATSRFGSNRYMQTTSAVSLGSPSEMWIFCVVNLTDVSTYNWIYGSSAASNNDGGFLVYLGGGDLYAGIQGATYVQSKTPITTGNKIISVRLRGGQTTANAIEVYINSVQATLTATHNGTSNATFSDFIHKFARQDDLFRYIGDASELLLKTGNESTNRVGIETNINDYYNVY
jgi:hypothetical protein